MDHSKTKIGILILFVVIGFVSCNPKKSPEQNSTFRFEKLVFTVEPAKLPDSIRLNHNYLVPFFKIFNEDVIRIGPDSLSGYTEQLNKYTGDSLIRQVYSEINKSEIIYRKDLDEISVALSRWSEISGNKPIYHLVTFISGFNQSFVTLPGLMAIGIDNYLGSGSRFYQGLSIPVYVRQHMNPENLPADAVRAWLYSELPPPGPESGFLDRMIYEGKIHYITNKLLSGNSEENLFHYSKKQLTWCQMQEKSMWKYLAEQRILFSSDRLTIRKFMEEAPFTRDFGNESPGRIGTWIGYRIVYSYMKSTGLSLKDLIKVTSAKEILSGSKYHP